MTEKRRFCLGIFVLCGIVVTGAFFYFNRCDAVCTANGMRGETQDFSHIDAFLFKEQLVGAVVIDVRTPEEYVTGHISGAMLIDFYADDFRDRIGQLDRDVPYYVYCQSDNKSRDVVSIMKTAGFKEVYGLEGGINAWRMANFELE